MRPRALARLASGCLALAFAFPFALTPAAAAEEAPAVPAAPSAAPPAKARPYRMIEVKGAIQPDLVPQLRSALEAVDPDRFPAGAVLILDSPGGNGSAAIEAGRLVRAAKAHTFVRGRCWSACVFILAAGVVRGAPDGAVGIHRARLTTFVKGIGVVEINTASNRNAAKALEEGDRRTEAYLREMGMPDALFEAMMATPADQTRKLAAAELVAFGLTGIDPAYREARGAAAAARYGIGAADFAARSVQVQDKCMPGPLVPRDFMRCYLHLIRTGE